MKRRIIGIDPGLANTGFGVIDDESGRLRLVGYGVVETAADEPLPSRLLKIHGGISRVVAEFTPDEAAMEELYFGRNATSALPVAEAKGVATLALAQGGLLPAMYRPNQIKSAVTGTQQSPKETVERYVAILLSLASPPRPDHAADALAAAITHAHCTRGGLGTAAKIRAGLAEDARKFRQ